MRTAELLLVMGENKGQSHEDGVFEMCQKLNELWQCLLPFSFCTTNLVKSVGIHELLNNITENM